MSITSVVRMFIASLILIWGLAFCVFLRGAKDGAETPRSVAASSFQKRLHRSELSRSGYDKFKEVAGRLAQLEPAQILEQLERDDPFGVRAVERRLLADKTRKNATATAHLSTMFSCPSSRITIPDRRNHTALQAFRSQRPDSVLFFQHLRKAGGTHFCTLAQHNLPKHALPSYYCMPDYHWQADAATKPRYHRCAGCLTQWTNEEIAQNMPPHRIAGNEWDRFEERFFELPNTIFVTSFRQPVDRVLSQFRFECVEDRGCKFKDPGLWWNHRQDLHNIYTATFSDTKQIGKMMSSPHKRAQAVERALDVLTGFHLVNVLEWLPYSTNMVREVLGFTHEVPNAVRPHIQQAPRQDTTSWKPENHLTPEQYQSFCKDLALDAILTDAARRIFLERVVCREY